MGSGSVVWERAAADAVGYSSMSLVNGTYVQGGRFFGLVCGAAGRPTVNILVSEAAWRSRVSIPGT